MDRTHVYHLNKIYYRCGELATTRVVVGPTVYTVASQGGGGPSRETPARG